MRIQRNRQMGAIDAARLRNYLVPRECPRVTYYAAINTTDADAERFLGESTAVVAIEQGWLEHARSCRLYYYGLPTETFRCMDECAGYFVNRVYSLVAVSQRSTAAMVAASED